MAVESGSSGNESEPSGLDPRTRRTELKIEWIQRSNSLTLGFALVTATAESSDLEVHPLETAADSAGLAVEASGLDAPGDCGRLGDPFQSDPDSKLFLLSLKAGGLGLNLTAADYVHLVDPWWNPAVEAQAIDRAHRIGQTRPVFATCLVARDTVEEKILELQQNKRDLADAIIQTDESLIATLSREDLELLLS